ncbi:MAG: hypothetical protein AMS22_01360 [Thiotrichales bacterium SG8_50]|nr:MAG: hypothetical protein AMS22_01360 [Thiotrichales bacterium SG8_50]
MGAMTNTLQFVPDMALPDRFLVAEVTFVDKDVEARYETSIPMQGCVIPRDGVPLRAIVTSKGMVVGAANFQYERPNVEARVGMSSPGFKTGFHVRLSTLGLSSPLFLEVLVDTRLDNGKTRRDLVGTISGTNRPFAAGIAGSKYSPIVVPALGRSGTTLIMGLLNAHPQVVAPGGYPFEYRQASYFWHAIRILSSPASFDLSMHPDSFEGKHFYHIGYNPYIDRQYHKAFQLNEVASWQDRELPISIINCFKSLIDQFVDKLLIDSGRNGIRYFAEKTIVSPMNDLVLNIYPGARQVFLVRDIRDSFVSARAFNRKRGYESFGFEGKSDEEVLASRKHIADVLVQAHRYAQDRTHFVRYEDLVSDMKGTLLKLVEFLKLDGSPETIAKMVASQDRKTEEKAIHATTRDTASSVERWRSELSENEKAYCAQAYREFFETFGYAVQ